MHDLTSRLARSTRCPPSRTRALVSALAISFSAALATAGGSAVASAFHQHSIARENTGSGFTGVQVTRVDKAVTGQPSDGCDGPYRGSPVYQTQWVILNSAGTTWRELGTGHQCNDNYRYWFWGYGVDGTWVSIGIQTGIQNGVEHTFRVQRVFDDSVYRYQWRIDGVLKATMTNSATGPRVEAGLESYAQNATVAGHSYKSLKAQKYGSGGDFFDWAGRDASVVHSAMCGFWVTDIRWRAGQGSGQC